VRVRYTPRSRSRSAEIRKEKTMTIAEHLISDFKMELEGTRKVLNAVPAERFDWRPHEKSMPLQRLAGHVAEMPGWTHAIMEKEMDFAALAGGWKPFLPETKQELIDGFERQASDFEKVIGGKSDEFMNEIWTMRAGDQVFMKTPRHTAIRSTVLHHTVHHRAQLTVYLRLLGVAVPGTYGPTADEPAMV
jgi:uncharacterized damage-inducible protein DinB